MEEKGTVKVLDIINLDSTADALLKNRVNRLNSSKLFQCTIICPGGEYAEKLRAEGIDIYTVDFPRKLDPIGIMKAYVRLRIYMVRNKPDIVHTHCSITGVIGRLAAYRSGVSYIIHTVHGFHAHERMSGRKASIYNIIEKIAGKWCSLVLFQNREDMEYAQQHRIIPCAKQYYIGNGIDLERFSGVKRKKQRGEHPQFVCTARFETVKNHTMLFKGLQILKFKYGMDDFVIDLLGKGRLKEGLRKLCDEYGLSQNVRFLGYRDDVQDILTGADLAFLTSVKEGIPRGLMEPMAMGIPQVATDVKGTREVVEHGVTGFLVKLDDAEGFAEAVYELMSDEALWEQFSQNSIKRARLEFDENRIIDRLQSVYMDRCRCSRGVGQDRNVHGGLRCTK